MKFKVGDKVRGIIADIGGCECVVKKVGEASVGGECGYSVRLTKMGTQSWHKDGGKGWKIGDMAGDFDFEYYWGESCFQLIEEEYKVGDVVLVEEEIRKITSMDVDGYDYDCLSSDFDKTCDSGGSNNMKSIIKKLHEPIEHFKYKNPKYFSKEGFPNIDSYKEPLDNKPNERKVMSVIKNAFMSKESQAVQCFDLGENSKNLNADGLNEFVQYLYETETEARKGFLAKLVEKCQKDKK